MASLLKIASLTRPEGSTPIKGVLLRAIRVRLVALASLSFAVSSVSVSIKDIGAFLMGVLQISIGSLPCFGHLYDDGVASTTTRRCK